MDDPPSKSRDPRPRVQFGWQTLLALVTAFALLFASGAWFGAVGYIVFFLFAALVAIVATPRLRRPASFMFYGFLLLLVIALWWFSYSRDGANRSRPSGGPSFAPSWGGTIGGMGST
jgi:energy-coupling factor transporter transmembrane protein EcfT